MGVSTVGSSSFKSNNAAQFTAPGLPSLVRFWVACKEEFVKQYGIRKKINTRKRKVYKVLSEWLFYVSFTRISSCMHFLHFAMKVETLLDSKTCSVLFLLFEIWSVSWSESCGLLLSWNVVHGPAISTSLGNYWEMQNFKLLSRSMESESAFLWDPWVIYILFLKFDNCFFTILENIFLSSQS